MQQYKQKVVPKNYPGPYVILQVDLKLAPNPKHMMVFWQEE